MYLQGFVRDPAEARPSCPSLFSPPMEHLRLKTYDSPVTKLGDIHTRPKTSNKLLLIYKWDAKGPASSEVGIFKGCRILREGVMVNDR